MWTFCFSVFVIWPFIATTENNFIYTNGWIPVSNDIVYEQIKRERTQEPLYIATHNTQEINTNINNGLLPQNKLKQEIFEDSDKVYVEDFETKCLSDDFTDCINEKPSNNPRVDAENDFVPNVLHFSSHQNETFNKTPRQAKKISDNKLKNYLQRLLLNEDKLTATSKYSTYEVTEESDLQDIFTKDTEYKIHGPQPKQHTENKEGTLEPDESETKDIGYNYEPPKKNQTSRLSDILSKYKINKDDELTNYALSRRQKAQIPAKQNKLFNPFQNQVPYKYNNFNHLPVDPVLAVFLSNYGYYLQGMYGIHNQYNNLYGYLASNNIHNNRPFGFYKVFSDTDSSH